MKVKVKFDFHPMDKVKSNIASFELQRSLASKVKAKLNLAICVRLSGQGVHSNCTDHKFKTVYVYMKNPTVVRESTGFHHMVKYNK